MPSNSISSSSMPPEVPVEWRQSIECPDEETYLLYLEVPAPGVVLLQAHFELYEGLGTVRTISIRDELICIFTPRSQLNDCLRALAAIQPTVKWRKTNCPVSADQRIEK